MLLQIHTLTVYNMEVYEVLYVYYQENNEATVGL